ncbi:MAG: acyl-CoA thioesterase [Calditrichia bacterium]|nr:acyl-CoA thioesterase [Calditrichia bacterium]
MFEYEMTIRMHHVDGAGVLFFANQFKFVHDAFEEFLRNNGFILNEFLKNSDFVFPIVAAQTNYKLPFQIGDKIKIKINAVKIENSSFMVEHKIYKNENDFAGEGQITHTCVDKKSGKPIPVPELLKNILLIG